MDRSARREQEQSRDHSEYAEDPHALDCYRGAAARQSLGLEVQGSFRNTRPNSVDSHRFPQRWMDGGSEALDSVSEAVAASKDFLVARLGGVRRKCSFAAAVGDGDRRLCARELRAHGGRQLPRPRRRLADPKRAKSVSAVSAGVESRRNESDVWRLCRDRCMRVRHAGGSVPRIDRLVLG